jgi:hypothetical protein
VNKLHPDVRRFKSFLEKNPQVVKAIRSNKTTFQSCYEQFILLGEDDVVWKDYMETNDTNKEENSHPIYSKMLNKIASIDINELEKHIYEWNGAIDHILNLVKQYQANNTESNTPKRTVRDPFSFQIKD